MIWTANTITRFSQEGENDFAEDFPCILTRYSLAVQVGVGSYTIPDSIRSIRRITYQGQKLDPLTFRNQRDVFQGASQIGKPFWYVFNNIGQNTIKLFPAPSDTINPSGADLWSDAIATDVIIEYFTLPDYATLSIPSYIRRRLVKAYVLKMCFAMEGQGQNLKNVQYFTQRYSYLKDKYGWLLAEIHNKGRKLCLNGVTGSQFFPGRPILPIGKFGISVEDGQ
jgi:hypothetical protein